MTGEFERAGLALGLWQTRPAVTGEFERAGLALGLWQTLSRREAFAARPFFCFRQIPATGLAERCARG